MDSLNNNRKEDHNGDEELLQAALAASQRRMESHEASKSGATEVLYNDGATPLYNAIEETKWTEAMDLLEVVPEQASIWVASTGTENTTFGWSLWRRLPIHEVRFQTLLQRRPQLLNLITKQ
jgi:hypothetical protein